MDGQVEQASEPQPRRAAPQRGRVCVPFENPLSSLPKTAQKILAAARSTEN